MTRTLRGLAGLVGLAVYSWAEASASVQAPRVQVGYCTRIGSLEAAKAAGFDYVELGTTEIAALSDTEFEQALARHKQIGLPTPAANLFLPATLKVTGPDINRDEQAAYVKKALARMARLGTTIIVFGSGGSRRVPDGFSQDRAFGQLVEFGRRAAEEAKTVGITIAIEPLRRQETNIINSAGEGLKLVNAVDHPNFQLMIDFYHLASEKEDPSIVIKARDHLRHLHMANPQGRVFPQKWEEFAYAPFFTALKQIGYSARISVEAGTKDLPNEAPQAIALLRRAFQ